MKLNKLRFAPLLLLLLGVGASFGQSPLSGKEAETALKNADDLWLKGSLQTAATEYESLLARLPKEYEPFRALLIMRLAQSQLANGDNDAGLATLRRLDELDYVPEHHALAADELKAQIQTGSHPGLERTPVPPLPRAAKSIEISPSTEPGTLAAAVAKAREAKASGNTVEIVLEPGVYLMAEPLALDERDAGLVIRSKDPEKPATLTGGVVLENWEKIRNLEIKGRLPEASRDYVRACDLSSHGVESLGELVFGGFSSRRAEGGNSRFKTFPVPELFYQGEPQTLSRWPDDELVELPVGKTPEEPAPRTARWRKEEDLWLYGYWSKDWADAYEKVSNVDDSGRISLISPTNRYGFHRRMGCAVNALSELDQPGEYYIDTARDSLYYYPPAGFNPKQCVLSAYQAGIRATNCTDLQIRDLRINHVRGDAATFENCPRLLLAGLDIWNCSGLGIKVHGGTEHLIHSCQIKSMGRGGVDFKGGDWQQLTPAGSVFENNRISRLSRIDRTYTPAFLLEGMGVKLRHNSFERIPSSAIRLEGCDMLIEMNVFRDCVYESGDQGAIDMWANPLYRGNIIRWNLFDRIVNNEKHLGAAAVRHDDFISGFMVSENIFRQGSDHGFGAIQYNKGTDNFAEGNLFIDWHQAFSGRSLSGKGWEENLFRHGTSKLAVTETDWKSEAWGRKYPMVRDLYNGDDNHNYFADNRRFGDGEWGKVQRGVFFANTTGRETLDGDNPLEAVKPVLLPWHPIPVDRIGPY